ncbi:glycosyl hydrolase family 98 putative carbohydrate binding module [Fibrisoma limi BUZ 3]|uniref:Glycosyl hydrolase family 98 putative carbohydrate binding module n=1 Tax=Fibrisoma limi BUZ 3 TaxID=1185876 RepID=I2GSV3_9BACT|nr:right-handed parallel beta-helix repeat-containing protein [Fibrisoma limi]CCH56982.1 glycosyl hydrolase family 98 putative carbohydrate binding module [Fibrisoma limi BUZ 3]
MNIFQKNIIFSTVTMLCILFCCIQTYSQTTYYVASSGNDLNNGTTNTTPFRTLAKVNTLNLKPGDKIFLRRGDTFRGTLSINQSGIPNNPIIVDAYGSGSKPVIAGSVPVINWTNIGNNKWQAICSECGSIVTGVYINSISQPLGRYPNETDSNRGYLTVQSHVGKTQFTSQQSLTTNWVGGEVVIRPADWILDRATINQQNGNTIYISNNSSYNIADGYGFFIQNHPNTLDKNGEWFYDKNTKKITLYTNTDPNNTQITATVYDKGIEINKGGQSLSNISIYNIHITQSLFVGLNPFNISSLIVSNCDITNSGLDGINITGTGSDIVIEKNQIVNTNNNAFQISEYSNFKFINNTIKRNGIEPGRGNSGDAQYIGFRATTINNTIIEGNTLDSIGYIALNFPFVNATVRRNIISNFCLTKSDGGGLYIVGAGSPNNTVGNIILQENIISHGVGAPEGTASRFRGANGIYLDACTRDITVENNTVFKCFGLGIYLLDAQRITVRGNTSFDNEVQFAIDDNGTCSSNNNNTQNNVFVAKLKTQLTARYQGYSTNLSNFGSFNDNYYARPLDDILKLQLSYPSPAGFSNIQPLTEWQSRYGKDLNSKNSPVTYKGYVVNATSNNEQIPEGSFNDNTGNFFVFSDYNNGQGTYDNSNKINGGSLKLSFSALTNAPGASLNAARSVSVERDKDYLIQFEAVSDSPNRVVEIFLQTSSPPFVRIVNTTPGVLIGTNKQKYELILRATSSQTNAYLVFHAYENNQPLWLDNISFKQVDITESNPDNLIKLVYNPSYESKTVSLDATYKDVRNQLYRGEVTLAPFTSVVLLRNTTPDLTPIITLPAANFSPSGIDTSKNLTIRIYEGAGQNTSSGNVVIAVTAPAGYSLSYNSTLTSIDVSGGGTVAIDNTKWVVTSNVTNGSQIVLNIKPGQFIPANGSSFLGFTLTRIGANSGSVSSVTTNIFDDPSQSYDGNSQNNIFVRVINAL